MNRDTQIVKAICLAMQLVLLVMIAVLVVTTIASSEDGQTAVIAMTAMVIVEAALWWIESRMDIIEEEREGNSGRSN